MENEMAIPGTALFRMNRNASAAISITVDTFATRAARRLTQQISHFVGQSPAKLLAVRKRVQDFGGVEGVAINAFGHLPSI